MMDSTALAPHLRSFKLGGRVLSACGPAVRLCMLQCMQQQLQGMAIPGELGGAEAEERAARIIIAAAAVLLLLLLLPLPAVVAAAAAAAELTCIHYHHAVVVPATRRSMEASCAMQAQHAGSAVAGGHQYKSNAAQARREGPAGCSCPRQRGCRHAGALLLQWSDCSHAPFHKAQCPLTHPPRGPPWVQGCPTCGRRPEREAARMCRVSTLR